MTDMDSFTFLAVLACAAAHALMNCSIKHHADPGAAALLVSICGGAIALPLLLLTGMPEPETFPFIAASVACGLAYWIFLGKAYAIGDVGVVFPVASGLSPAITLILSALVLNEVPSPDALAVVLVVIAGVFIVVWSGIERSKRLSSRALAYALLVATATSAFIIVDAAGARIASSAFAYVVLLHVLDGLTMLVFGSALYRGRLLRAARTGWPSALAAGAAGLGSYGILMWAMTRAPVPLVAALRESSVIFAAVIAIWWLREPLRPSRIAGAGVVATGIAMLKFV